jgi:hypothetical protein
MRALRNALLFALAIFGFDSSAWRSIAYSVNADETLSTGVSASQPGQVLADQDAVNDCVKHGGTQKSCVIRVSKADGCWALAASNYDQLNHAVPEIASGPNQARARDNATLKCINDPVNVDGVCAVRASFCEYSQNFKPSSIAPAPWYYQDPSNQVPDWNPASWNVPYDTLTQNKFLTASPSNPGGFTNPKGYSPNTNPPYCRDPSGYWGCMKVPNPFTGGQNTKFCHNNFC